MYLAVYFWSGEAGSSGCVLPFYVVEGLSFFCLCVFVGLPVFLLSL